jgi:hypothetical protein
MPKTGFPIVLIVDSATNYGCGNDLAEAIKNYSNNTDSELGKLSELTCRVVHLTVAVTLPHEQDNYIVIPDETTVPIEITTAEAAE